MYSLTSQTYFFKCINKFFIDVFFKSIINRLLWFSKVCCVQIVYKMWWMRVTKNVKFITRHGEEIQSQFFWHWTDGAMIPIVCLSLIQYRFIDHAVFIETSAQYEFKLLLWVCVFFTPQWVKCIGCTEDYL